MEKKKMGLKLIRKLLKLLAFSAIFVWTVISIFGFFSTRGKSASLVKYQSYELKDFCSEKSPNLATQISYRPSINRSLYELKRRERSVTPAQTSQSTASPTTEIFKAIEDQKKPLDRQEQWRRAVYGNNYLDELVLVGASTHTLYADTTYREKSCLNSTQPNHDEKPMLNLLNSGFRYFELSVAYDHKQRHFYWQFPAEFNKKLNKREISEDIRQICPFARNHSGEMFLISLSYCSSNCEGNGKGGAEEYADTSDDTRITEPLLKTTQQDNDSFLTDRPTPKYDEFDFLNAFFPHRKFWKSYKRKALTEDPTASHFLTVVKTLVKACAMPSDIPLTRTVAEMLATEKNVIFTIRSPNFLIPPKHQKTFRIDEILRKNIWSSGGLNSHHSNGKPFNWFFPYLTRKDNSRFFTQPFTVTHLKLIISTRPHHSSWFDRWPVISTAEFGCATFDIAFLLLVVCCFVLILKKLIKCQRVSSRKSGNSVWLVTFYAVLALFHFLASYHAFQCFPRVILPFNVRAIAKMSSQFHEENHVHNNQSMSNATSAAVTHSNSTLEHGGIVESLKEKLLDEICSSIESTFHRWLLRQNEKKINMISITVSLDELLRLENNKHDGHNHFQTPRYLNTIISQSQEINICTKELIHLADQANLNLLKKLILLKHSGTPMTGRTDDKYSCASIKFLYSISSYDEKEILLSGSLEEGEEFTIKENTFPINSKVLVYISRESLNVLLYSEHLQFFFNNTMDIYLRGTDQRSRPNSGFAYVSSEPDVTGSSCSLDDLPRSNRTLKIASWSS